MKTSFLKSICSVIAIMLIIVQFSFGQSSTNTAPQKVTDQNSVNLGDLGVYKIVDGQYNALNYQSTPQQGSAPVINAGTTQTEIGRAHV